MSVRLCFCVSNGGGCVGEIVGVGVCLHIPHLVKGASCTKVHTEQGKVVSWALIEGGGGRGEGRGSLSPPTSIGQDPADVDGGGEGGGGVLLKRRLGALK